LIRDTLLALQESATYVESSERSYDEHYAWLLARTDPSSELERRFLTHLYETGRRLPSDAQYRVPQVYAQADFFYQPDVCVFVDGAVHDQEDVRAQDHDVRWQLKDVGYEVVVIRYDRDLEEQIAAYPSLF